MLICPPRCPTDKFIRVLETAIRDFTPDTAAWTLKIRKIKPCQDMQVLIIGDSVSHLKGGEADTIAVSILKDSSEDDDTRQLETLLSFVEGYQVANELPEGAELLSESVKQLWE